MTGFGGAVKLTGESEYRAALSAITQNLKEVSSEMKMVSAQFDKNDRSTEALTEKGAVLVKMLEQQENKMNVLKQQYLATLAAVDKQVEKHAELVEEYTKEKAKLDQLKETLGESSKEYQDQQAKVRQLAHAVVESAEATEANEKMLSNMRIELNRAQGDINKTAKELNDLGDEAQESGKKAEKSSDGYTVLKNVLANLTTQAINVAISGLKKLGSTFVSVGKQAYGSFAQFEQLEGGVRKIFGDELAQEVMENANNAFNTSGLSANEYMEQVTKFSATLLQGLGEDSAEAAKYADMAIKDMSDNANTFGTDISSIQNAYQGFAKDNFTMLDNLRLGYGGTASEMARLINESGVLGDTMTVTAQTVKDVPFHKMVEAINVTQRRVGVFGTTTAEAATTIEGSTRAMQAAWKNLVAGMANDNADFATLAKNFVDQLVSEDGSKGALANIIPRITKVITGIGNTVQSLLPMLISRVAPIITDAVPEIMDAVRVAGETILAVLPDILGAFNLVIPRIVADLISGLPMIADAGIKILLSLIDGISATIPELIKMLPTIIKNTVDTLIKNLPDIIKAGMALLQGLIDGLSQALPELIKYVPEIIGTLIDTLLTGDNLTDIITGGADILLAIIQGIINNLGELTNAAIKIVDKIVKELEKEENLEKLRDAGWELVKAIAKGMVKIFWPSTNIFDDASSQIANKFHGEVVSRGVPQAENAGEELTEGVGRGLLRKANSYSFANSVQRAADTMLLKLMDATEINSPSKLTERVIGDNLALGIGVGFERTMRDVSADMANAIPTDFDVSASVSGARYGSEQIDIVAAFKEALSQMKIELDDNEVGQFVENTVAQAIYV